MVPRERLLVAGRRGVAAASDDVPWMIGQIRTTRRRGSLCGRTRNGNATPTLTATRSTSLRWSATGLGYRARHSVEAASLPAERLQQLGEVRAAAVRFISARRHPAFSTVEALPQLELAEALALYVLDK